MVRTVTHKANDIVHTIDYILDSDSKLLLRKNVSNLLKIIKRFNNFIILELFFMKKKLILEVDTVLLKIKLYRHDFKGRTGWNKHLT